jgi:hypothetical protein
MAKIDFLESPSNLVVACSGKRFQLRQRIDIEGMRTSTYETVLPEVNGQLSAIKVASYEKQSSLNS